MTYFWIGLAVVLIVVGLFLMTQGGAYLGQPLVLVGIVIGLILAICPTHASSISATAISATQVAAPIAAMTMIISSIVIP